MFGSFAMLHYAVSNRSALFSRNLVLAIYTQPENSEKPLGLTTLFNDTLKIKTYGKPPRTIKFSTERERIEAIKQFFGIGNLPSDAEQVVKSKGDGSLALP